jgi:hypothetical protein
MIAGLSTSSGCVLPHARTHIHGGSIRKWRAGPRAIFPGCKFATVYYDTIYRSTSPTNDYLRTGKWCHHTSLAFSSMLDFN